MNPDRKYSYHNIIYVSENDFWLLEMSDLLLLSEYKYAGVSSFWGWQRKLVISSILATLNTKKNIRGEPISSYVQMGPLNPLQNQIIVIFSRILKFSSITKIHSTVVESEHKD